MWCSWKEEVDVFCFSTPQCSVVECFCFETAKVFNTVSCACALLNVIKNIIIAVSRCCWIACVSMHFRPCVKKLNYILLPLLIVYCMYIIVYNL
jgi:hypothetical protein